jgi:hypothetical protein
MGLSTFGRRASAVCIACTLLAGCAASQMLGTSSGGVSEAARGWMAPTASAETLLYVSDSGANRLEVYSYPGGSLAGQLTGLSNPTGLCTDKAGDVWAVETASDSIVEYAHAGTKPQATLKLDGTFNLLGCAVDSTTGNLAVTELGGPTGGGALWIFADAKGTPVKYTSSALTFAYFCAYDSTGNLYIDGLNASGEFTLVELPSGSSTLATLTLNKQVNFPGGLQWHSGDLAIGDQAYQGERESAIYRFTVSGSSGSYVATTTLDKSCDVLDFDISSNTVVAPDGCLDAVRFYKFPHGEGATKTLSGLEYPVGAAISPAS